MLKRWKMFAGCLLLAFGVAGYPGQGQADDFKDGAAKFIQSLADRAISTLTVQGISKEERRQRFRSFLNDDFAVNAIGKWVLGKYWNQATEEQRAEYQRLFENLLVVTYADRFADYKGEKLAVLDTVVKDSVDVVVYTQIDGPDSPEPLKVDWRVRAKEGKYKIIDVMVTGISMGQTQRSEFASVIHKNGGSIDKFLEEMRDHENFNMKNTEASKAK